MPKITITFPDKSEKSYEKGITALDAAKDISEGLARNAIAAKINDQLADLTAKIDKNAKLQIITFKDKEGIEVFRHGSAHILAHAVMELFPYAKPTIGPVVEEGFYYDFDHEPFSPEDLAKIEEKMKEIVKQDIPIERVELSKDEAKEIFKDNPYKLELIDEFKKGEKVTAYKQGIFIDLCRGPHVPSTGKIKAFKLTKIAGAYWRGNAENKQLQRIYGISFPDKKDLNEYLRVLEEAEKRDHRKLGKDLELFSIHDESPGFIFWHPKGMTLRNELMTFIRELLRKSGYKEILTPLILNKSLWLQSGHWDHYKENMYFTKIDQQDFAVKPMNCPGGILMYKEKLHSYREFPLRIAEFGLVHRHELSGVLAGLFRVRAFTQDDAHVFCLEEQIKDEIIAVIDLIDKIYKTFEFSYYVELSTKPEKAMGDEKAWKIAEKSLEEALKAKKIEYKLNPGEGAFYGPKIDFHIKDCLGRTWQCATIQLDFSMPEKFNLTYEGKDGKKHRPVMLHRAIFGSLERFIGILIEHYAGKFPLWISPEQVRILTVADRFNDYAEKVAQLYFDAGIRVTIDSRTETISKKVRDAQLSKVNYILVVGEKEKGSNTVTIRTRENEVVGAKDTKLFLDQLLKEIKEKK